jgi:ubiquinone/menaquinone biosynthesis C-methylase UbiE
MGAVENDVAPSGVRGADFAIPEAEMEALLARNARQVFVSLSDPAWLKAADADISKRKLGLRTWMRRLLSSGRNARKQGEVRGNYEYFWRNAQTQNHVERQDDRNVAVQWGARGALVSPQLLRQVHLAYFMRAIENLRPQRVLEVGCGNGNVLLTLAARFPETSFTGVELTEAGVAAAKALQAEATLPESMAAASPSPLLDLTAHTRVDVRQGDASKLPFPDQSFDLVYTRLALEQMEAIREEAMREVTRVAKTAVVLLEPWRDFNGSGVGREYIRRQGYFAGRVRDLEAYGFNVIYATEDLPQKVQFSSGPAVALRRAPG